MPKPPKKRLDEILLERGLASDLQEAAGLIMSGQVLSENSKLDKPGMMLPADFELRVKGRKPHIWVSRGGTKLKHGLAYFNIDVTGMVAVDIGASTGGFTDVLLHNGTAKVYAVDVGYGELAWKLRQDKRVVVLERTNAKDITTSHIPDSPDIIVCDASFISLKNVLPSVLKLASKNKWLVALIKPQFEVRQGEVGEKGVVRNPALHERVCNEIKEWLEENGWHVEGITPSPIKGPEGNIEFLIGARRE